MSTANSEHKPGFFERASRFFRDIVGEMKKVVWPTRKQAKNNTLIVFAFMLVMGIVVSALDFIMAFLLRLLFGSL